MINYSLTLKVIFIVLIIVLFSAYFFINHNKKVVNIKNDTQNNSMIELDKVFSLDSGESAFYENISFSFAIETTLFSKDPVSGIEKYPHDLYVVNIVWNGLVPNKASKLYFNNIGDYQEFSMNSVKYELNLISAEKSKAEFILKEIVGLRQ